MSREYTKAEQRRMILDHVHCMVGYWGHNVGDKGTDERLSGLAFSLLAMLDGASPGVPRMLLVPSPHPDDKAYRQAEGENYWPDPPKKADAADLAQEHELHHLFYHPEP